MRGKYSIGKILISSLSGFLLSFYKIFNNAYFMLRSWLYLYCERNFSKVKMEKNCY